MILEKSTFRSNLTVIVSVLVLASMFACSVANRMSGVSSAKELQKTGEAAQGKILKVWDTGITVNEDPVVGLLVEVTPSNGLAYQATIEKTLISRIDIPRFQPGSVVPVRVDRENPQRVAVDVYSYR